MRRVLWLATALLLTGCSGSGFYGFLGDVHEVPGANPNLPPGASENTRKVEGDMSTPPPLLTEPGNIWPGPPPPQPSLADIERQQNSDFSQQQQYPISGQGSPPSKPRRPYEKGSSTPPENNQPPLPPPGRPGVQSNVPLPPITRDSTGTTVLIPGTGNATDTGGTTGYRTLTGHTPGIAPGSIMVPNGNGTSTVIGPTGTVTTIPTPK